MSRQVPDPHQKALAINLDKNKYGAIAEIGAGQETARWFFRVGGSAGTIAKAMSAYDMKVSDSIYGPAPRYVSRERLRAMIDHEYGLVMERLGEARGTESTFFAFSNTVAAYSYSRNQDGHGWLGIAFQMHPGAAASHIDIHVHLQGRENLQDQETLGLLGLNLIYGAMFLHHNPDELLHSLTDNICPHRVEVDMIEFWGAGFEQIDNRLMTLRLVEHGLTHAAMFRADGCVINASDALYKKAILIQRSRFRPPTKFTTEMIDCACREFVQDPAVKPDELMVLSEMTLKNLVSGEEGLDVNDYLARVDILGAMGKNVLISDFGAYHHLADYLFRYTRKPIGVAMGIPTLAEIFNEKYYDELAGGILESFGRMFRHDLRFYVCPSLESENGNLINTQNFIPPPHLRHLYEYLLDNAYIRGLDGFRRELLSIYSHEALDKIQCGDSAWEEMLPEPVVEIIKQRRLFGCQS